MRQRDDRVDDRAAGGVAIHLLHELAIDLERVERHPLQLAERRIAGAEVVHVDEHAHGAQPRHGVDGLGGVLHGRGLGDLQAQALRRQARLLEDAGHVVHHGGRDELPVRDVHPHRHLRQRRDLALPPSELQAGVDQHQLAQRHDEAGLLGDGDERVGHHQPARRVTPPHQRLQGRQPTGAVDDGLVVKLELVALDGAAELRLRRPAGHGPLVHLRVEQRRCSSCPPASPGKARCPRRAAPPPGGSSRRRWWRCRCCPRATRS